MSRNSVLLALLLGSVALAGCSDSDGVLDPGGEARWLAIEPTQCGGSPWEEAGQSFGEFVAELPDPPIDTSIERTDRETCLGCNCLSGERYCIRTGPGNVAELLEAGFAAAAPAACGVLP